MAVHWLLTQIIGLRLITFTRTPQDNFWPNGQSYRMNQDQFAFLIPVGTGNLGSVYTCLAARSGSQKEPKRYSSTHHIAKRKLPLCLNCRGFKTTMPYYRISNPCLPSSRHVAWSNLYYSDICRRTPRLGFSLARIMVTLKR